MLLKIQKLFKQQVDAIGFTNSCQQKLIGKQPFVAILFLLIG
jgi:hypothetical protein